MREWAPGAPRGRRHPPDARPPEPGSAAAPTVRRRFTTDASRIRNGSTTDRHGRCAALTDHTQTQPRPTVGAHPPSACQAQPFATEPQRIHNRFTTDPQPSVTAVVVCSPITPKPNRAKRWTRTPRHARRHAGRLPRRSPAGGERATDIHAPPRRRAPRPARHEGVRRPRPPAARARAQAGQGADLCRQPLAKRTATCYHYDN